MHITIAIGSTWTLAALLAIGCGGEGPSAPYVGSGDSAYSNDGYGQPQASGAAGSMAAVGGTAADSTAAVGGNAAGSMVAVGGGAAPSKPAEGVVLASSAVFQMYFTDSAGRALYMFANDVPGSNTSACAAACLDKWPVFDVKDLVVGMGLTATDFNRFQRTDGSWQTAFKGRPLYRFAADTDRNVSGDGAAGRWFVARDYFAFVAAKTDLTPQGASAPAPYMTNRAGRTVYVFMNDTPAISGSAPVSACSDKCLEAWPAWNAPPVLGTPVVPSSMKKVDIGQFERVVAGATVKQLTYRGWPLYFHTPDMAPGDTTGHLSGAWRAIDPTAFPAPTPTPAP